MKTFNFKKIITGIFLSTMIFLLGSSVNAMNGKGSGFSFKKGSPYFVLDSETKARIDTTRLDITQHPTNFNYFPQILDKLDSLLSLYDNVPDKQSLISRTIGIAKLKGEKGYAVNKSLLSKFISTTNTNLSPYFNEYSFFEEKKACTQTLIQALGYIFPAEQSSWFIYRFRPQKINLPQNTQALPLSNNAGILGEPLDSTQQNTQSLPKFNNPQFFGDFNPIYFDDSNEFQEDEEERKEDNDNDEALKILQNLLKSLKNN